MIILRHLLLILFLIYCHDALAEMPISYRLYLSRAYAENRSDIGMLIVTKNGKEEEVKNELLRNGAKIRYVDMEIGYIRANVPLNKVILLSENENIISSALAAGQHYLARSSEMKYADVPVKKIPFKRYMNLVEKNKSLDPRYPVGLLNLWNRYPTYDGRGTTVAIIEDFFDPSAPDLLTARELTGKQVDKVVGLYAIYNENPGDLETYPGTPYGLVNIKHVESGSDQTIVIQDQAVRVPHKGSYEAGMLNEKALPSIGGDLNKDGNLDGSRNLFAVARSVRTNCIYVDTNHNDDLSDEECYKEYNISKRGGQFRNNLGVPIGAKFYIASSNRNDAIIVAVANSHTQTVASVLSGNKFWESSLGGVAPNTQLISIATSGRLDGVVESLIFAAKTDKVDVILQMFSYNHAFDHGRLLYNIVADRVAEKYNKVIVSPAGNAYQMLNTVTDGSVAESVLAVGQYHEPSLAEIITGRGGDYRLPMETASGPSEDGAIKPDVVASSLWISPYLQYFGPNTYSNALCPRIGIPSDVSCASGTSLASPTAAGLALVVISAARQMGIEPSQRDVRMAIQASAKFIKGRPVHLQGRGLINVMNAVEYLKKAVKYDGNTSKVNVNGSINTGLSADLPCPRCGRGLYEREGWHPGKTGVRYIEVKRSTGVKWRKEYKLKLIGNDHRVFSVPEKVYLDFNKNQRIPVRINIREQGLKSAILRIFDQYSGIVVADIGLYVVGSIDLSNIDGNTLFIEYFSDGLSTSRVYIDVPEGTEVLQASHHNGRHRDIFLNGPMGWYNFQESLSSEIRGLSHTNSLESTAEDGFQQSVYLPAPGVWELVVHRRGVRTLEPRLENIKIDIMRSSDVKCNEIERNNEGISWEKVIGAYDSGSISIKKDDPPALIPIKMQKGMKFFDIRVKLSDDFKDKNIFYLTSLLKCAKDRCYVAATVPSRARSGVFIDDPTEASWYLALDTIRAARQKTEFHYEIFTGIKENLELPRLSFGNANDNRDNQKIVIDNKQFLEAVKNDINLTRVSWVEGEFGFLPIVVGKTQVPLCRKLD